MAKELIKESRITKDDVRNIKVGSSVTFQVNHPREINVVKVFAYRLNSEEPELRRKYSCKSDYKNNKVTVTANPL